MYKEKPLVRIVTTIWPKLAKIAVMMMIINQKKSMDLMAFER